MIDSMYRLFSDAFRLNRDYFSEKYRSLFWRRHWKAPSIHHIDTQKVQLMYENYSPIFILSPGRTATKFLSTLFSQLPTVDAFHEPFPSLQGFSNYVYHNQDRSDVLTQMFEVARSEAILDSYVKNRTYLETNQVMTFFAPQIAELYKNSKFVHVTKHPGDFIRSAVRKGWYANDTIWESGRIKHHDSLIWNQMSQIQKLSWLWSSTNEFIESFKRSLNAERVFTVTVEDVTSSVERAGEVLTFIDPLSSLDKHKIKKIQNKRINENRINKSHPDNMNKIDRYPKYENWSEFDKNSIKEYISDLSSFYGYHI